MISELIEYSLETPKYNFYGLDHNNILNSKILTMLKNNNMTGGNNNSISYNYIIMIIGIIIIIIGFILCWYKNDLNLTDAQILNFECDNSQYKINIMYNVNQTSYKKTIIANNIDAPRTSTIPIYYKESNPNIVRLYKFDYSVLGLVLMTSGILVILSTYIIPLFLSSNSNKNKNLYSSSRSSEGINIVYTK